MREIAIKYHNYGLHVIPTHDKVPTITEWAPFVKEQTLEDVQSIFNDRDTEIAILCTEGMEMLDFDIKHYSKGAAIVVEYVQAIKDNYPDSEDLIAKLVVQQSRSGGYHIIWKANNAEGNQKLAMNDSKAAFIETRGKGGYFIAAPSEGYELKRNDFSKIPTLSNKDRDRLIAIARSFNEFVKPEYTRAQVNEMISGGQHSWDVYDQLNDGLEVLVEHGWTVLKENDKWAQLNRPNARTNNIDGSWNKEQNYFYCFTSSDYNFDNKGYSPTAVFSILNASGDFKEGSRQLYNKGYGNVKKDEKVLTDFEVILKEVNARSFNLNKRIVEEDAILQLWSGNKINKVGTFKNIGVVVGKQKSRKTTLLNAIVASAMGADDQLGFKLSLAGKTILHFDTEQSEFFYDYQVRRIFKMAGLMSNIPTFKSFQLRPYTRHERMEIINYIISKEKNVGLIVIDGVVDICEDYMQSEPSIETVGKMMEWTDRTGAMLLTVLHLNKGKDGTIRGHLGSELQNKADFVIEVRKLGDDDGDGNSKVICRDSRFRGFTSFEFTQRDDGTPYLVDEMDIVSFVHSAPTSLSMNGMPRRNQEMADGIF